MTETVRYMVDHVAFRDVCQWLRTNNVDPNEIPVKTPIEDRGDRRDVDDPLRGVHA